MKIIYEEGRRFGKVLVHYLCGVVRRDEMLADCMSSLSIGNVGVDEDRNVHVTFRHSIKARGRVVDEREINRTYKLSNDAWDEVQDELEMARISARMSDRVNKCNREREMDESRHDSIRARSPRQERSIIDEVCDLFPPGR